jgi:hypothetical protein
MPRTVAAVPLAQLLSLAGALLALRPGTADGLLHGARVLPPEPLGDVAARGFARDYPRVHAQLPAAPLANFALLRQRDFLLEFNISTESPLPESVRTTAVLRLQFRDVFAR